MATVGSDTSGQIHQCHACYFSGNCLLGQAHRLGVPPCNQSITQTHNCSNYSSHTPNTVWSCKHSSVFVSARRSTINLQHLTVTQVGLILPAFYDSSKCSFTCLQKLHVFCVLRRINSVYLVTSCRSVPILPSQRYLNSFWLKFWIQLPSLLCAVHVPAISFSLIWWPQYHLMWNTNYDSCHYTTVYSIVSLTFKHSIFYTYIL